MIKKLPNGVEIDGKFFGDATIERLYKESKELFAQYHSELEVIKANDADLEKLYLRKDELEKEAAFHEEELDDLKSEIDFLEVANDFLDEKHSETFRARKKVQKELDEAYDRVINAATAKSDGHAEQKMEIKPGVRPVTEEEITATYQGMGIDPESGMDAEFARMMREQEEREKEFEKRGMVRDEYGVWYDPNEEDKKHERQGQQHQRKV